MTFLKELRSLISEQEISLAEPMAKFTSIRVGGIAECLIRPINSDSLVKVLGLLNRNQMALQIVGGGANTIIGDEGIAGICLKLKNESNTESVELDSAGATIEIGAGTPITRLIALMKMEHNSLVGAEFLAGIPGTIGGAVAMNAGTKNGECMTRVSEVELATSDGIGWVSGMSFRYRHTDIPKNSVVTRVRFKLPRGNQAESKEKMEKDLAYRKSTQPLTQPNFGSVFTNPPGQFAGALIEQVNLKGHRIGNAQLSTKHANWIVNLGGALAKDVTDLMDLAQSRVKDSTGIELHPEVKRLGQFK
jgi:UDP-N-acetylmuramate dehydrogenase